MPEISPSKYLVTASWAEVPHIDAKTQADLLASTPPYLRDARTKGIPSLGAGAIYPIELSEVLCDPFELPEYWPRAYALDVGWKRTAALWGAWDRSVDCVYLYTEHYRGKAEPSIHATAIRARGEWIPGLIDPAARGRAQKDGERLTAAYRELGLNLLPAKNAVEAGIYEVWNRLSTGRLKVFRTLQNWQAEYRLYRRNEDGKVVKEFDHLMDCFHPDTLVWTDKGLFPIRELPETGLVLTVGGNFVDYQNCGIISRDVPVVRVAFSGGASVTCTPDHLFMTPTGWTEAKNLMGTSVRAADGDLLCCVMVEPAGRSDVYCLEVPSTRAFAVGPKGVLAHNCTRYLVLDIRKLCRPAPARGDIVGSASAGDPMAGY